MHLIDKCWYVLFALYLLTGDKGSNHLENHIKSVDFFEALFVRNVL